MGEITFTSLRAKGHRCLSVDRTEEAAEGLSGPEACRLLWGLRQAWPLRRPCFFFCNSQSFDECSQNARTWAKDEDELHHRLPDPFCMGLNAAMHLTHFFGTIPP